MYLLFLFIMGTFIISPASFVFSKITHGQSSIVEIKANAYDQFMRATYLHEKGENKRALKAFNKIIKTTSHKHMLEPYISTLFDCEDFKKLVSCYEKNKKTMTAIFKKNPMAKGFIAQAYLSTGNKNAAQKLFSELSEEHGNDPQICYFIAVGYLKTKNHPYAINFLKTCIQNGALKTKHYLFHFLLSKAHLETNNAAEAMNNITASITQYPKFERGWLFQAILHEQQGKISEAINGYKKFLDLSGRDESIEKQLIQLLFNQQRFSEAASYLEKLSNDSPEYCFDLALIQSKSGNYTAALPTINKALSQNPTAEKSRLLKIEILMNSNKTTEALGTIRNWLNENPHNHSMLHMLLLLNKGGVPANVLIKPLEAVHTKHPDAIGIIAALGDMQLESGNTTAALDLYKEAAEKTPHQKLKSKIIYQRCYIMFEKQDRDGLLAELTKAHSAGYMNHALLNLHAYTLAQQEENLTQALDMINQALKTKPQAAAYMDTKAVILQKMNQPAAALQLAKKALSLAPHDQTIQKNLKAMEHHYAHIPRSQKTTIASSLRSSR